MKFLSRLFAVLLSFSTLTAHAVIYYVDNTAANDNGNGTSTGTAWKTLAKVNAVAWSPGFAAGDEIRFRGGQTFIFAAGANLYIAPGKGGTQASPITFTSYGTGQATLVAANDQPFAYIWNAGGLRFTNLIIRGNGSTTHTKDGISFYADTLNTRYAGITFDNVEMYGFGKTGLIIGGWAGTAGFSQISLLNSRFRDNGIDGCSTYGQNPFANQNITVRSSHFYNNAGKAGLADPSGSGLVLGAVDTALVEFCTAYNNGANNTNSAGPIGIWTYMSRKVVIQYNVSHSNKSANGDGGGFDIDGASEDCVIQYNYSYDNVGAGYLLAQYTPAPGAFRNNVIRYNISQNDAQSNKGYGGIMIWGGDVTNKVTNSQIYNNVIFVGNTSHASASGIYAFGTGGYTGIVARNNIVVTTGGRAVVRLNNYSNTGNLKLEGNNYFSSGSAWQAQINGTTYTTLPLFRGTGQEMMGATAVGLAVDPQLVNAGGGGTILTVVNSSTLGTNLGAYRLASTSPLINAGLTPTLTGTSGTQAGTAAATDFYGNAVPTAAYDIGVFESSSVAITPVINSGQSASGTVGTAFSYTLQASNSPTSWSNSSGLPAGVTLNTSTGVISGTPTASGSFTPSFTATNTAGTSAAQSVAITISAAVSAPVVTVGQTTTGTQSSAFSYQILTSNSPTSYALASGTLPTGVSLNTTTGLLSGTPSASGSFSPSFTATNTGGTSPAVSIAITINAASGGGSTFRIMTAGDSITANNNYQNHMRTFFTNGGFAATWLGTQGSAPNRHEGWSGRGLDHFNWPTAGGSTSMKDYMDAQFGTTPAPSGTVNVVTLLLGINNMDHGLGVPGGGSTGFPDPTGDGQADGPKLADNSGHDAWITSQVDQLVNTILNHPSNVRLVIAKIPPVGRGRDSLSANFAAGISRINRLNTTYQTKYDGLSAPAKERVRIVDMNTIAVREYGNAPTFDWGTQAQQEGDWVHPRPDAGLWSEMGQTFYNAIVSFSAPTYPVSGTVTLGAGGQSGVTVSSGGSSTVTDSNGNFSLSLSNAAYTLTPSLSGFSYTPTTRSVTVNGVAITGQNFTATALPTYSITGTITVGAAGLNGVTVSDGTRTATTNVSGVYTLNNVPQGAYTITPSLAGYSFSPVNRSGTLSGNLTNQDFSGTFNPATYEGFSYTAGVGALAAKSGGTNWSGAWDGGANDINATGLTYTSGGTLTAAGGKGVFVNNAGSFRNVSASAQPDGTYWISFLARSTIPGTNWGGLSLFNGGAEQLFFGQRSSATNWGVERSGGAGATTAVGTGTVSFIVAKIVLKAGTDDVYLWANPSLASTPSDGTATQLLGLATFTFDRIRIQHGLGTGQTLEVDEVRIGQSYADVAPTGSGGGSAPVITTGQTASGTTGQAFSYTVTASNSPTSWALASGSLPNGVTLATATGVLSGTPTAGGTFTPSFTATNGVSTSAPQSVSITIAAGLDAILTGTVSGSAPFGNFEIYDANKVFDGNTATFFAPEAATGGFVQIDLGTTLAGRVSTIRFMAREGHTNRMSGGVFQGSNNGTSWSTLHTVSSDPGAAWQQVSVSDSTFYRYLRYQNASGFADIAEVEFRGVTQAAGSGLTTFRTTYGLLSNGTQDALTPAGDGVPNLLKYAFNMVGAGTGQVSVLTSPNNAVVTASGSSGLPLVDVDGTGKLRITYIRRMSTSNSGISYSAEFSDTLANGTWAVNASATTAVTSIDTTFERVVVTDNLTSANKRFVRARVTAP